MQDQYLDHLVNPSFQGVNILSVLSFESETGRRRHTGYYFPKIKIKDYNVIIKKVYKNIQEIATGQGDEYTSVCLFDYPYFKEK